jgi:hypothetical protein
MKTTKQVTFILHGRRPKLAIKIGTENTRKRETKMLGYIIPPTFPEMKKH